MTDLDTLLSQAAHFSDVPPPETTVDADLARGRRALTHRRMRRTGTRSVLAGALAIGAFAAFSPGSHPATSPTAVKPVTRTTAPDLVTTTATSGSGGADGTVAGIQLVAYTGEQPKGYTVDSVPSGWEIQGVNNYVLVIAPKGFADRDVNSFVGKLVVMLQSEGVHDAPSGEPVQVGPYSGVLAPSDDRADGFGPTLFFTDAAGHQVVVQTPAALHWSDAQIAAFGASVHVNPTAEAGKG